MRRNSSATTHRHTTTGFGGGVPRPDRDSGRTTAGAVAFVAVPVAVVAAAVAPVATAVVAMAVVAVAFVATGGRRADRSTDGETHCPGDTATSGREAPAD